jgi:hypothetical protein
MQYSNTKTRNYLARHFIEHAMLITRGLMDEASYRLRHVPRCPDGGGERCRQASRYHMAGESQDETGGR